MRVLVDYCWFRCVFSRHTLYYNRANHTLDNRFHSCLACWKGCNRGKSDFWRCFAGNACWTNSLLHRGFCCGLFPRRFSFNFRLHFGAHCLDLGFQSQLPNRLAQSNSHSNSGVGHLYRFKHNNWGSIRNSISCTVFPQNLEKIKARSGWPNSRGLSPPIIVRFAQK